MLEIKIEDEKLVKPLQRLIQNIQNASPIMQMLAGDMLDAVEENFAREGRPKWLGLKPGTIASRQASGNWPGKILQRSGQLAAANTAFHTQDTAGVSNNKKYAAIQHFGGQTAPHVIRPRNKKALAFGGRVVAKVNHPGSKIPARPFMMVTDADQESMIKHVSDYLLRISA